MTLAPGPEAGTTFDFCPSERYKDLKEAMIRGEVRP